MKSQVLGPHRWPVEREDTAALKDSIDDRVRQVLVMQHTAPCRERPIRREDHRAFLPVTLVDDIEEHVRGIGPVREVATSSQMRTLGCT